MLNKYLGVILTCLVLMINISAGHAQNAPSDEITIAVPHKVITKMIKAALPLSIENGRYLKGSLWIQAIDHLNIGSDSIAFDMDIRGENIKLETRLANQTLLMDIGKVKTAFRCDASLRYDAPKRTLYITPNIFQKPNENEADNIGATLLQLLTLANGVEYPVEIQKIQPFVTQISKDQFNIDLAITNIFTEKDKVFITGQAQFKKVMPSASSGKKAE